MTVSWCLLDGLHATAPCYRPSPQAKKRYAENLLVHNPWIRRCNSPQASINTRAQEVHEGLQRQHDAVRAFLGQPPAHYVPLQGRQETVQVVQRLVKAFGSWPGVLGPLCTMCAVEDPRVAKLLWFLRVDLTCMLVVGESVKVAVRRALNAREVRWFRSCCTARAGGWCVLHEQQQQPAYAEGVRAMILPRLQGRKGKAAWLLLALHSRW